MGRIACALVAGLATATLGAACGNNEGGMLVRDAWLRPTAPGVTSAALYLHIDNRTSTDDVLLGGTAEPCMVLSPHLTLTGASGMSEMTEPGEHATDVAAGESLDLVPQGLHLMCYGLDEPLQDGEEFDVALHFQVADDVVVRAVVGNR